jgi:hypothetical protein
MSVPPYDPPPPPPERRSLTTLEVGLILGVVALVVFCCLGWGVLAVFAPAPH